ncbi:hypothetical protein ACQ4PT_049128 [Festuca glaucescens]
MKRLQLSFDEELEVDGAVIAQEVMLLLAAQSAAAGGEPMHHRPRAFECKTCNRQFPSFQALGGHRASHKRPRGSDQSAPVQAAPPPRRHGCAVCGVEFALGQALGGHMRRHRAAAEEEKESARIPVMAEREHGETRGLLLGLDLNAIPSEGTAQALDIWA